jgi:hypothetical protein
MESLIHNYTIEQLVVAHYKTGETDKGSLLLAAAVPKTVIDKRLKLSRPRASIPWRSTSTSRPSSTRCSTPARSRPTSPAPGPRHAEVHEARLHRGAEAPLDPDDPLLDGGRAGGRGAGEARERPTETGEVIPIVMVTNRTPVRADVRELRPITSPR